MSRIIRGLTRADYDALPRVSCSQLKHIARSPAQFQWAKTHPKDSADFVIGRCLDMRVLESERYAREVAVFEGTRRGRAWEEFRRATKAAEILTTEEANQVEAMALSLMTAPKLAPYLKGDAQVACEWERDGVELKSLFDLVASNGALVDLKTTRDASAEAFGRQALSLGYLIQAAMYVDALAQVEGSPRPFLFVCVEKAAPYEVAAYVVGDEALEAGRQEYRRLLAIYRSCAEANVWPGYEPIQFLKLPKWSGVFNEGLSEE